MTVDELIVLGNSKIHKDLVKILIGDLLNLNPLELLLHLDENVPNDKVEIFKKEIDAVFSKKPLQYVLGYVNFYGNRFYVDERVLIPRYETEELVENTLDLINKYFTDNIDIIDLGCGSGIIGLTLKSKLPKANVTLLDISSDALDVTKKNALNMGLMVNYKQNDMLKNINEKYDVVISNPPYIKLNEGIEQIVEENEPHLALYGGEDGLHYYKKILFNIKNNLKEKFLIAFEIGADQKEEVEELVKTYLADIKIISKKDMQNRDRMIFIMSNNLFV